MDSKQERVDTPNRLQSRTRRGNLRLASDGRLVSRTRRPAADMLNERIIVTGREDEKSGGPDYGGERGGKSVGSEGGQGGKGEALGKGAQGDQDPHEAEDASSAISEADRAKDREREMEESGEELPG